MNLLTKYQPDKQIENYAFSLNACIGKGSSGTVYIGKNQVTEQVVAIKAIDMRQLKTEYAWKMLCSEVKIMKKLKHPHVVRLLDVFQTKNNTYIITEFCNQGDLRTFIKQRKSLSEEEAIVVASQLISGLHELAAHGIIHRDLKPANILVHDDMFKITDFGFAKKLDSMDDQLMDSLVGTPLYMAPQILHKQQYTSKCDSWSVGLILFELLYGRTPWPAVNVVDLVHKISSIPLSFPKDPPLSTQLLGFLMRCLCFLENERISIQEMCSHSMFQGYIQHVLQKIISPETESSQSLIVEQEYLNTLPSNSQVNIQKKENVGNFESTNPSNSSHFGVQRNKALSLQNNLKIDSQQKQLVDEKTATPIKSNQSSNTLIQNNQRDLSISPLKAPQQNVILNQIEVPNYQPLLQDSFKKLEQIYNIPPSFQYSSPNIPISPLNGNQTIASPFHMKNKHSETPTPSQQSKSQIQTSSGIKGENQEDQKLVQKPQQQYYQSFNYCQSPIIPYQTKKSCAQTPQVEQNMIQFNDNQNTLLNGAFTINQKSQTHQQIDPLQQVSHTSEISNNFLKNRPYEQTQFNQIKKRDSTPPSYVPYFNQSNQQRNPSPKPSNLPKFIQQELIIPQNIINKNHINLEQESNVKTINEQETIGGISNKYQEQVSEFTSFNRQQRQFSSTSNNQSFFHQTQQNQESPDAKRMKSASFAGSNGLLSTKSGSINPNTSFKIEEKPNQNIIFLPQTKNYQSNQQQLLQLTNQAPSILIKNQQNRKEFESVTTYPEKQKGHFFNEGVEQNNINKKTDYENVAQKFPRSSNMIRDTSPSKPPNIGKRPVDAEPTKQPISPSEGRLKNELQLIEKNKSAQEEQGSNKRYQIQNLKQYEIHFKDDIPKRSPLQNHQTNCAVNRSRSLQQQKLPTFQKGINSQCANITVKDLSNHQNQQEKNQQFSDNKQHSSYLLEIQNQQNFSQFSKKEKLTGQQLQYNQPTEIQSNPIQQGDTSSQQIFGGYKSISPSQEEMIVWDSNKEFSVQESAMQGMYNLIEGVHQLKIKVENILSENENNFSLQKLMFLLNRYLVMQSSQLKIIIMDRETNLLHLERWQEFREQISYQEIYQRVSKQYLNVTGSAQINQQKAQQQQEFQSEAKRDYYFGKMLRLPLSSIGNSQDDNTNFYFYIYSLIKQVIKEQYQRMDTENISYKQEDINLLICIGKLVDFHQLLKLIISQKQDFSLILQSHQYEDIIKDKPANYEFYSNLKQKMCLYDLISQYPQIPPSKNPTIQQ